MPGLVGCAGSSGFEVREGLGDRDGGQEGRKLPFADKKRRQRGVAGRHCWILLNLLFACLYSRQGSFPWLLPATDTTNCSGAIFEIERLDVQPHTRIHILY